MVVEEMSWSGVWWAFLVGVALISVVPLGWALLTIPESRPAAFFPIVFVVLLIGGIGMLFRRLRVTLDADTLTIGFGPFRDRLSVAHIVACTPTTYRWLAFGGFGIRYNWRQRAKLYNVAGDGGRAIQLTLDDGRLLLFSSRDPDAVCAHLRLYCPNCRQDSDADGGDRPVGQFG